MNITIRVKVIGLTKQIIYTIITQQYVLKFNSIYTKTERMLMRKELKKMNNLRRVFTATVERFGRRNVNRLNKEVIWTIVLKNITDKNGKLITDHVWFNLSKEFDRLNLREGDRIEFSARVVEYYKRNYQAKPEKDFKLEKLVGVKKIARTEDENKV